MPGAVCAPGAEMDGRHHVGTTPGPQKKRMEEYWLEASNQLMNKLYQPKCARIACNAEKSASAWLTTIPHTPDLLIPDAAVTAGLRCRLLQVRDRTRLTKRKILDQRLLDEFKMTDFECKLVTTSTNYTSTAICPLLKHFNCLEVYTSPSTLKEKVI